MLCRSDVYSGAALSMKCIRGVYVVLSEVKLRQAGLGTDMLPSIDLPFLSTIIQPFFAKFHHYSAFLAKSRGSAKLDLFVSPNTTPTMAQHSTAPPNERKLR